MEARSLILGPEQYTQVSAYDLLRAAEQGFVGLDHRFLHAIVDDPEKSIPDLLRFGLEMEQREDARRHEIARESLVVDGPAQQREVRALDELVVGERGDVQMREGARIHGPDAIRAW